MVMNAFNLKYSLKIFGALALLIVALVIAACDSSPLVTKTPDVGPPENAGDINLNGLKNEIADAIIYSNFFVYGISAFDGLGPQRAEEAVIASDVNGDGLTLTIEDFQYLVRLIVGDALPLNKLAHDVRTVEISTRNGVISSDTELGSALFVFEGFAVVNLLASNMNLEVGVVDGNTHVLVFAISPESIAVGEVLSANSELISTTAADYNGNRLNTAPTLVPNGISLHQNYPNPFNPSTRISFDLPHSAAYSLTITDNSWSVLHLFSDSATSAGTVLIEWVSPAEAPSGIYFYTLKTGDFKETKSMLLIR